MADWPAATTEEYDGTSWTSGGDLGTARMVWEVQEL